MKYRELTQKEMEAYKIGYKVGARELFITDQEWESEEEHSIYRKGYLAGCKDRERKNLKPELLDKCQQCQQCQQCQNRDSVTVTVIENKDNSNMGVIGGKEKEGNQKLSTEMIHMLANSYKATDAVIVEGKTAEGKKYEGIQIKNKHLLAFVKQRFNKNIMQRASKWALDHQQQGYTYNASRLLKLLCKFQRDYEPTINYGFVQAEYLGYQQNKNQINT